MINFFFLDQFYLFLFYIFQMIDFFDLFDFDLALSVYLLCYYSFVLNLFHLTINLWILGSL